VLHVGYELIFYILFRRNSVFKGIMEYDPPHLVSGLVR
jgi:hypothetical protein